MIITLKECTALCVTIHQLQSQPLPFRVSFKLNKLAKALQDNFSMYIKAFNDVVAKYGKRDADGKLQHTDDGMGVVLQEETSQIALKEMQEIDQTECEIPDIWFTVNELENLELSPQQIEGLQVIIKEEESN